MAPSTSTRENILAHIETTLAALAAGDTYNFTADKAARVDPPFFLYLDESLECQYFIEVGQTRHIEETQDGIRLATMEVFITGMKRWAVDHLVPDQRDIDAPSTVRSKLLGDLTTALVGERWTVNHRRTYLTDDAELVEPEIEQLEGWAGHECRFEVEYEYDEDAP